MEKNTVGKTDVDHSKKTTNFIIWATKVLKEYMIKGVVMDDERLKNPNYIFEKIILKKL